MTSPMNEKLREKRAVWLMNNRGALSSVAEKCNLSSGYVSDIYRGNRRSRSGEVETLLAEMGAPGFERRAAPPAVEPQSAA